MSPARGSSSALAHHLQSAGPDVEPGRVQRQLVGVFARRWLEPLAEALGQLWAPSAPGSCMARTAWTRSPPPAASWVASLENGKVTQIEIAPEDAGLTRATLAELKGGDAAHNAAAITRLLAGQPGPIATSCC